MGGPDRPFHRPDGYDAGAAQRATPPRTSGSFFTFLPLPLRRYKKGGVVVVVGQRGAFEGGERREGVR